MRRRQDMQNQSPAAISLSSPLLAFLNQCNRLFGVQIDIGCQQSPEMTLGGQNESSGPRTADYICFVTRNWRGYFLF